MNRENFNDLYTFLMVAEKGSFTRAAAELGVTQSALSHTIRGLEKRVGIRLLTRTTRSLSPTEAGQRLINSLTPSFESIQEGVSSLSELRDKPAGTLRISSSSHAADTILIPKLESFLKEYPDINVEIDTNNGFADIVTGRFDAGVRLGEAVAQDMIATRIGPDMRMVAVATPSYFSRHSEPNVPNDLIHHNCIGMRQISQGGLYAWEFEKEGRELNVHTNGQLTLNNSQQLLKAILSGIGIGFIPEDMVQAHIIEGSLKQVLNDWCPSFPGFHLYYPNRREASPAFSLLVERLRNTA